MKDGGGDASPAERRQLQKRATGDGARRSSEA